MASSCGCKARKNGQVTAVKQVAKKNIVLKATNAPVRVKEKNSRVMYKRPI
jgi:hypothetical protein